MLLYYGALKLLDPAKDTATDLSWKSFVGQMMSLCFGFDDEVLGKGFFFKKSLTKSLSVQKYRNRPVKPVRTQKPQNGNR